MTLCLVPLWECYGCLSYKRAEEFNKSYTISCRPVQHKCKICEKEYRRQNKEKISLRQKKYAQSHREIVNKHVRNWRVKNRNKRRLYLEQNKEKIAKQRREYYLKNKENILKQNKQWNKNNKEKVQKQKQKYQIENREKHTENMRRWRKENPDRERKNRQKYAKFKRQNDPKYALRARLGSLLKHFLKNEKRGQTTKSLVGYSMQELKTHIEKSFIEGMCWDQFLLGEIEIHHIVPNSAFEYITPTDEAFYLCWSLKNLCPEWKTINRKLNDDLPDGTKAKNLNEKIKTQEQFDYWYPRCLAMRLAIRLDDLLKTNITPSPNDNYSNPNLQSPQKPLDSSFLTLACLDQTT